MALFAMLTGIALPAHAYRNHAAAGVPGADFCTTVKPVDAAADNTTNAKADTPTAPDRTHAVQCDTCCGSAGAAAAPALPRPWATPGAALTVSANLPAVLQSAVDGFALARGPPARA